MEKYEESNSLIVTIYIKFKFVSLFKFKQYQKISYYAINIKLETGLFGNAK